MGREPLEDKPGQCLSSLQAARAAELCDSCHTTCCLMTCCCTDVDCDQMPLELDVYASMHIRSAVMLLCRL